MKTRNMILASLLATTWCVNVNATIIKLDKDVTTQQSTLNGTVTTDTTLKRINWDTLEDITLTESDGNKISIATYAPQNLGIDSIWFTDVGKDIKDYNSGTLQDVIKLLDPSASNSSYAFVYKSDFDGGSISNSNSFNYLSVHFGQADLFFKFLNPITSLALSVNNAPGGNFGFKGFSNYRLFSSTSFETGCAVDPTQCGGGGEVPLPAAAWLFGTGIVGLFGIRRKKSAVIC